MVVHNEVTENLEVWEDTLVGYVLEAKPYFCSLESLTLDFSLGMLIFKFEGSIHILNTTYSLTQLYIFVMSTLVRN